MSAGSYSFVPSVWRASGGVITPRAGATQVQVPSGTAAAPGLASTAAGGTNDGIRIVDTEIQFISDGAVSGSVNVTRLRSNARIYVDSSGTAGDPAVANTFNLDGVYFPADNQVSLAANAKELLRADGAALAAQTTAIIVRDEQGAGEAMTRVTRDVVSTHLKTP